MKDGFLKQKIMSIQENQISDQIDGGLIQQKEEQLNFFKNQPAFPVEVSTDENGNLRGSQTSNYSGYELGISKREYFASKAMQALLSNPEWMKVYEKEKYLMQSEIVAKVSIEMADAVLKELSSLDTKS